VSWKVLNILSVKEWKPVYEVRCLFSEWKAGVVVVAAAAAAAAAWIYMKYDVVFRVEGWSIKSAVDITGEVHSLFHCFTLSYLLSQTRQQ